MRVDFMMIGAQKSGTTSVAVQLESHPEICFCKIKEPGFFHKTADWRAHLDDYHQLFAPQNGQLCGEASTMYTFWPEFTETPARLHTYNPQLKFIYIMRHPVERIVSHYTHNFVRNIVKAPPEEVVLADPAYVNRSRYGVQLRPYLELFGSENILLLLFEEYVQDQVNALQQIAHFLDIDPAPFANVDTTPQHKSVGQTYLKHEAMRQIVRSDAFGRVRELIPSSVRQAVRRPLSNKITKKPPFAPALKQTLWHLVEDDVCTVESLMQRRLSAWREGYTA